MKLNYHHLPSPIYVFGAQQRASTPILGLRTSGPFDPGECPPTPRVLFVFADELREDANRLFLALKNGIGPFRGCDAWFHFDLVRENVARVAPFHIGHPVPQPGTETARSYERATAQYIATMQTKPDIALILHPKTERSEQVNPYLYSKYPLLAANVPTQVITSDLIQQPETFRWSVGNIALQIFAKLGGVPWIVESQLEDDFVVVGINRAIVSDVHGATRFYGFAATFSQHGVYKSTKLFAPANSWNAYLSTLRTSLGESLEDWRRAIGSPVNLVLHMRKEIGNDEVAIISDCMERAGTGLVKSYAVLRLAYSNEMLIFDPHNEAYAPPSGTMVRLAGHRALLQIAGLDATGAVLGKAVNQPLHVRLLRASPAAPPLEVLCQHILALSAMNWRGLNAEAVPVSLEYAGLLADLLARFSSSGFDPAGLTESSVLKRPWFL